MSRLAGTPNALIKKIEEASDLTLEQLVAEGIIFNREFDPTENRERSYIYIKNPFEAKESTSPLVVKLETWASEEDIEKIKKQIIPTPEFFKMLVAIARAYQLKQPLLIEGPTAVGKTFTVNTFVKLLYGSEAKPLDFYCSGQTDVSELMAKWVPKVETEEERKRWNDFLNLPRTQEKIRAISEESYELLYEGSSDQEDASQRQTKIAFIQNRLQELAKEAGLGGRVQWTLQYGAVPKAMCLTRNPDGTISFDDKNGQGFILHIQEVGLAEPQVITALLGLRGSRGKLVESIQLWQDGGREIKAGPNFWVCFSTNPPEEYLARNEIDPALARGVVFLRMEDLSSETLKLAAKYIFTYKLGEKPREKPDGCILEIYNYPEIGEQVGDLVAHIHDALNQFLKQGEKGRRQRVPLTLDDMARVADALIVHQISGLTGMLDLPETLKQHIEFYYFGRLADPSLRKKAETLLSQLLDEEIGIIEFEGARRTRREVLNYLVEKYSLSDVERENLERQQLESLRQKTLTELLTLLESPNVSNSVKEELTQAIKSLTGEDPIVL